MKRLAKGKFLSLVEQQGWEWCERNNCNGVACIVPITPQGEAIFVEQYRPPIKSQLIEWPAGLVGDEDKSELMIEAARRELEEETGYYAHTMTALCRGPASAGVSSELLDFYLAEDLEKRSQGGGVDDENIIVHCIPISKIDSWLKEQQKLGKIIDLKVYTGLYFLKQK